MVSGFKKDTNKSKLAELLENKKQLVLLLVVGLFFLLSLMNMFKQLGISGMASTSQYSVENVPNEQLSQEAQEIAKKVDDMKQDIKEIENDSQMVSNVDISSNTLASKEKTVSVEVDSSTNQVNPFLPTIPNADIFTDLKNPNTPRFVKETITVMQTPSLPKVPYPVYVAPPPLKGNAIDPAASALMSTTVSGIMYDAYSPSAVIKFKDTDYLVKKGDIIKGCRILGITNDSVKLQYGKNIYVGKVGQLLVKSDLDYTKNISNINSKFGGQDVSISVRKY